MEPSVELVSISDNRKQAWIFSRPWFDHSDLETEKAMSMDMGVNSLCMLTFEITSSVMFRDFLFSIRPLYAWARSSRDIPFSKDNLSISREFDGWGRRCIKHTLQLIKNGMPQDEARINLPMTLSTSYTISMDFRTVCGLIKTMEMIDNDLYKIYGLQFHNEIQHIQGYKHHEMKSFYNSYALIGSEEEDTPLSRIGNIRHKSCLMKAPLAAQFLRQSHSIIKTNIWNKFLDDGYFLSSTCLQDIFIQVAFYIPVNVYDNLMRLRSHWFANWADDMWGNMIEEYTKEMSTEEFWKFIPCGNSKPDPYHYHTLKRVNGDDHNLPCPIALEYPDLVYERLEKEGVNRVIKRYVDLVEENYIKDNPNNELRKKYVKRIEQGFGKTSNN